MEVFSGRCTDKASVHLAHRGFVVSRTARPADGKSSSALKGINRTATRINVQNPEIAYTNALELAVRQSGLLGAHDCRHCVHADIKFDLPSRVCSNPVLKVCSSIQSFRVADFESDVVRTYQPRWLLLGLLDNQFRELHQVSDCFSSGSI